MNKKKNKKFEKAFDTLLKRGEIEVVKDEHGNIITEDGEPCYHLTERGHEAHVEFQRREMLKKILKE